MIERRQFIAGLGSAAAWPVVAGAQQQAMPVIGFLNGNSAEAGAPLLAAFRQGLREERYIDGENVTVLPRWADNQYERLPVLAMELVSRHVAVIAAGTPPAAQAAKAATKQLGLIHELVPQAGLIAVLLNPDFRDVSDRLRGVQDAGRTVGLQLEGMPASTDREIDSAFAHMIELRVGGLIVFSDPFLFTRECLVLVIDAKRNIRITGLGNSRSTACTHKAESRKSVCNDKFRWRDARPNGSEPGPERGPNELGRFPTICGGLRPRKKERELATLELFSRREKIVALASTHTLSAIYDLREFATAGGLMSYGSSIAGSYRQAGIYPADLPVQQPTKFEFVRGQQRFRDGEIQNASGLPVAAGRRS